MQYLLQVFRPFDVTGLTKVRLGPQKDGGYIVPPELAKRCSHFISFGVGGNWGFEEALAKLVNQEVHLYDHTVTGITTEDPRLVFHQQGLECVRNNPKEVSLSAALYHIPTRPAENLLTLAKALVDKSPWVFVKMDVEGAEWETLNKTSLLRGKVGILVVEIHGLLQLINSIRMYRVASRTLANLYSGFVTFHTHLNNYSKGATFGPVSFANAVEVTYINRKWLMQLGLRAVSNLDPLPVPGLDFPNGPEHPDLPLKFFG